MMHTPFDELAKLKKDYDAAVDRTATFSAIAGVLTWMLAALAGVLAWMHGWTWGPGIASMVATYFASDWALNACVRRFIVAPELDRLSKKWPPKARPVSRGLN